MGSGECGVGGGKRGSLWHVHAYLLLWTCMRAKCGDERGAYVCGMDGEDPPGRGVCAWLDGVS